MKGGTHSHPGQAHQGQGEPQDRADKPNSQVGPEVGHNHITSARTRTIKDINTCPAPAIPPVFLLSSELKKFARTPEKKCII